MKQGPATHASRRIAVLYHIFYEDTLDHLVAELLDLKGSGASFYFNICLDNPALTDIRNLLLLQYPGCLIITSSNKGKDIGGKLLLLKLLMTSGKPVDWVLFLHDKRSLQAPNGDNWKEDLFRLARLPLLNEVYRQMEPDGTVGIIAHSAYVVTERREDGRFAGRNADLLASELAGWSRIPRSFEYVAGTMFWANTAYLFPFFSDRDPVIIRGTLEQGNVIDSFRGTNTHAWERLLSWVITSSGGSIKRLEYE